MKRGEVVEKLEAIVSEFNDELGKKVEEEGKNLKELADDTFDADDKSEMYGALLCAILNIICVVSKSDEGVEALTRMFDPYLRKMYIGDMIQNHSKN